MLLLASASPRRAELLRAAGIQFEVYATDVDESPLEQETPEAHVRRLAKEKAFAAATQRPDCVVLGADTVVVVDGRMLGKPKDAAGATSMLRALSGRAHEVLTGVALILPAAAGLNRRQSKARRDASLSAVEVAVTRVWFSLLSDAEIESYVRSGEPMDKAGAYAIQGLGSRFVERIEGSYSNVVGLPVAMVYRLLQELPKTRQLGAF